MYKHSELIKRKKEQNRIASKKYYLKNKKIILAKMKEYHMVNKSDRNRWLRNTHQTSCNCKIPNLSVIRTCDNCKHPMDNKKYNDTRTYYDKIESKEYILCSFWCREALIKKIKEKINEM